MSTPALPLRLPDGSIRTQRRAEGPRGVVGDAIVDEPRGTEEWKRLDAWLRRAESA